MKSSFYVFTIVCGFLLPLLADSGIIRAITSNAGTQGKQHKMCLSDPAPSPCSTQGSLPDLSAHRKSRMESSQSNVESKWMSFSFLAHCCIPGSLPCSIASFPLPTASMLHQCLQYPGLIWNGNRMWGAMTLGFGSPRCRLNMCSYTVSWKLVEMQGL